MSDAQQPNSSEPENTPPPPAEKRKPKPPNKPDWKPLGSIRDSFAEQIRQDELFR